MLTLFHHPFCPHSRFVRLALGEYGLAARTVEERVWERRQEFLILNPACTTPVVVEEGRPAVPGAAVIAEYLDETRGGELGELRLLPREIGTRVEVRRLMNWFNDKFFAEVSGPLTTERLYKRQMPTSSGGGSPDTEVIRAARHNMRYHLAYIGWLVRTRDWLAGGRMSYADLAAAAHLSAADYLADVPSDPGRDAGGHPAVGDLRRPRLLNDPAALKAALVGAARQYGFDAVGIARPDSIPQAAERLRHFLAEGAHGDMDWMETTAVRREHPGALWPQVRAIIMLGLNYGDGPDSDPLAILRRRDRGAISVYARGDDYHDVIKFRLKALARW